jgi:hypothetical protein
MLRPVGRLTLSLRGDRHKARGGVAKLVLRVELSVGESFRGIVAIAGSNRVLAFDGWVSFMAAIDDLRRSGDQSNQ